MKNTEKMNQEILDEYRIMSFLGSPIFTIVCCN